MTDGNTRSALEFPMDSSPDPEDHKYGLDDPRALP